MVPIESFNGHLVPELLGFLGYFILIVLLWRKWKFVRDQRGIRTVLSAHQGGVPWGHIESEESIFAKRLLTKAKMHAGALDGIDWGLLFVSAVLLTTKSFLLVLVETSIF
jgi:hypothetical protein